MGKDKQWGGDVGAQVEVVASLPLSIEKNLYNLLLSVPEEYVSSDRLKRVKETLKARQLLDYDVDWAGFTYLYYGANYVKAYLAWQSSRFLIPNSGVRIVDLGCGGGASTIGVLSALMSNEVNSKLDISNVVAVDRCGVQLDAFTKVARPWVDQNYPKARVDVVQQDIFDFLEEDSLDADVIILSYVMAELNDKQSEELWRLLEMKAKAKTCEVIVIESDSFGRGVTVERLDRKPFLVRYDSIKLKLPLLRSLQLQYAPKFTDDEVSKDLVRKYFDAWVTHDAQVIREIFSEDATYEILGSKTLRGIDEIEKYWVHNSRTQRNVKCGPISQKKIDGGVGVIWSADFERVDCGESRRLDGMLWLILKSGKISKLSEAYSQKISSINVTK